MQDRLTTALRMLRVVADRPDPTEPLAVGMLAQDIGVTTSSASRTAAALAQTGLLEHAEGYGTYRLGRRAAALSGRAGAPWASAVDFALTRLAAATGETVTMVAPAPGGPRVVAVVPASWTVYVGAGVGELCDPAGAAAQVLQPAGPCGRGAPRSVEHSGGVERDELAVAVHDPAGQVVAALVVLVPTLRTDRVVALASHVLLAARATLESAIADPVPRPHDHRPNLPDLPDRPRLGVAVAVLEHLCATGGGPVPEVATRLDLRLHRLERIISAAADAGLLEIAAGGSVVRPSWYLHGWHRAVTAAVLDARVSSLAAAAARAAGTTAYLTVRRGNRSVTVAEAFTPGTLSTQRWLGRSAQMFGADGGALLVMDFDDDQIAAVLPARAVVTARHTPRDLGAFLQEVQRARRDDLLVLNGFSEEGLTSVAAPVRGASGTVLAAACLVGPTAHIEKSLDRTIRIVRRLARDVSHLLVAPDR